MSVLLIDSDIFAFQSASRNQSVGAFGTYTYDEEAIDLVDARIAAIAEELEATRVIMCLTDPDDNFRFDILPTYKSTRDYSKRPELLSMVKNHLATEYESYIRPRLEADDVMGILATHPTLIKGDKIIVSEDKDMRTIPCHLYNPGRPELKVIEITRQQAHAFHMWQTICGDPTDGFKGAVGIGKSSMFAIEVLEVEPEEMWDIVLDAYAMAKLTEDDAIVQACMAKILTYEFYDFKNKEALHWSPLALHY